MKKICIIFGLLIIIILTATGCYAERVDVSEYFRIHVRANSNEAADQQVKYYVKDLVSEYLAPIISGSKSKADAMEKISAQTEQIEKICDEALGEKGFSYKSEALLKREEFPLRVYEGTTLPHGEYDSLIINLGSGKGDNWWCVIYPPLCFSGENIEYKSKIKELIDKLSDT